MLVERALLHGDVPDRLFERGALLERQPAAEHQLAPIAVQVMLSERRA